MVAKAGILPSNLPNPRESIGNTAAANVASPPPPGLQGGSNEASSTVNSRDKKKNRREDGIHTLDAHIRVVEDDINDLLNRSRRLTAAEREVAMQNTSTLRKRIMSDAAAATTSDKKAGGSSGRSEPKSTTIERNEVLKNTFGFAEVKKWKKNRDELIKKLASSKEEQTHPMTLSFLLRGQLIAFDR